MSSWTLLAVALLLSPAIAARDVVDMTGASLEVNDPLSSRELHPSEWLAYSWDPDRSGKSANFLRRKKKIFSYEKEDIEFGPSAYGNVEFVKSESLVEALDKITAALDIGTDFGQAFAASVSAGMDAESSTQSKQFRSDMLITTVVYHASSVPINQSKKLREEVRQFLVTKPPEEIIEKFGAFFAAAIDLGGLVRSTVTKIASEDEDLATFQSKAVVAAPLGTVQAAVSQNSSAVFGEKSTNSEMSIKCSFLGGDSHIWLGMHNDVSLSQIQKDWAASINANNMEPIRFTLKPIWSLLESIRCADCQERAAALKLELTNRWQADVAKLTEQDDLPRRVPGQVDDVVTFVPMIYPQTRMFVEGKKIYHSQRWSRVGKHTREAEAFKITRGLVDQNLTHFSFEPVASDAQAQYVAACGSWWWGKYVCHKVIKTDDDERRATWVMRNNTGDDGFEHNTKSFESLFYPGYFMKLEKTWVRLSKPGAPDFSRAASWKVEFAQLAS